MLLIVFSETNDIYISLYHYEIVLLYMLQSIVGTSHYRKCLKFSVITGND